MENAGEVPIDVSACCPTDGQRLCPAEYKFWGKRLGEGRGDSGLLLWGWSFSHQDMGFGYLEVGMRNHWNWGF